MISLTASYHVGVSWVSLPVSGLFVWGVLKHNIFVWNPRIGMVMHWQLPDLHISDTDPSLVILMKVRPLNTHKRAV